MAKPIVHKSKRARGTGAFFPYAGGWIARVIVGRKANGKPRYAERRAKTHAALLAKLALVKPPEPSSTVAAWCAHWLAGLRCRPGTKRIRTSAIETYITPTLGNLRLADVTPEAVNDAQVSWATSLKSANSMRLVLAILSTCLEAAVARGLRRDNPVRAAHRPAATRKRIDPFSAEELERVIAEASRRPSTYFVAALAATGMRIGEALALEVADFDAKSGTLSISRTQANDAAKSVGPPKSANGVRVVRVRKEALEACQDAARGRTGGRLFPAETGRPRAYPDARKAWAKLLKRLALRYRNPHQLRHSVATLALARGVPVGDVAAYLGDTPESIFRSYCHASGVDVAGALETPAKPAKGRTL